MNSVFNLSNIFSEFKCSIKLALPIIASEIIYASSGFISTIMVAHLGKEQLAANILVWAIYVPIILFFIGIFHSTSIMIAQSFGAKYNIGIGICFKQGLIIAIISALPMMFIIRFVPIILVWTKQDPMVIHCATPLFYSMAWTMLPLNILMITEQFLISITKTTLAMFMSILSVPIQLLFFYGFLFGKLGMPKIGLAGIGYGSALAQTILSVLCLCYLYFSKKFKIYSLFKKWWIIEYKFLVEMFRIGLPLGFMWCSELVFFTIIAIMMGRLGVTVLAAYQISHQYLMIALAIIFGLHHGVAVRVGNEVGCNNRDKLKLTTFVNMGIGLGMVSIFAVFYLLFPQAAISLDIDATLPQFAEVATEAAKYFPIVGALLITDCIRLICSGAARSLKDTKFQLIISIFGFWVIAFPATYLLAFKFGAGGVGIWWGIVIGLFVTGIILLLRFNYLVKTLDLLSLVTKKE